MRILVIDDDPKISDFLKNNLETELFAVDVATDGEKGAYLGRCNDYDLIVLDNVLPKKNGLEVCKEIREKKKGVKIIMLSALSDVTTKVDLLDNGADDYLTKPFSFRELLSRVKALLRRPQVSTNEVIKIGDLVIDANNHEVTRGKKNIGLTRKEFMLLEYLAKNAGRTLTQIDIMEHVWDMELDSFSHTLKSHVRNLRAKIDGGRKTSIIQTVNGRGYKMEPD
ncbi:MAG: response regulator transcription factor [Smithellaceae bacterium]|jgi:DNA-binding response OmpR family regulator|nr:response regulator transcription factor [Smithellaceae bacterium]